MKTENYNELVTRYIGQATPDQRMIMTRLRELIHHNIEDIRENFKWSRPVFTGKKDLVYLKSEKTYVTLGFFNAEALGEDKNKLEGTGKDMRHLKIRMLQDLDGEVLGNWLHLVSR